ncbi:MAG: pirin [Aeromicrobium sp.]|nr:pirin [Aeromicrobium sp.]
MTAGDLTLDPREVPLGGLRGLTVHRTLPQRGIPTVGAWCFVDQFGPTGQPMTVLPHPHTGLQTVTWLLAGEIRHRDSLGSDVVLRPGELNLMTSGDGVSHSEFSVDDPAAAMHGIQLWVALPADARRGAAGFEHHPDLPVAEGDGWTATVLLGELAGAASPATAFTPIVGAELLVRAGWSTVPVKAGFEHAVLAVDGAAEIDGADVPHRSVRYLGPGRDEITIHVAHDTTVLLIGGEPFDDDLVMWWNFIGRSHEEIVEAREDWQRAAERFGHVDGHGGRVIPAPPLPEVRLTPRRRSA